MPRRLSPGTLAAYEGRYVEEAIVPSGKRVQLEIDLTGDNGQLRMSLRAPGQNDERFRLAFYRKDHVVVTDEHGAPTFERFDFLRSTDGRVQWLRHRGRLARHQVVGRA